MWQSVKRCRDRVDLSTQTERGGAIEAFGQINGVADGNFLRIHLIGPDFKIGKFGLAVDGPERAIHGVQTVSDLDAADARDVVARVERVPLLPQVYFTIAVKIHRYAGVDIGNVRQVSRYVAGGQIKGAAQRYSHMGEVATDAVPPFD